MYKLHFSVSSALALGKAFLLCKEALALIKLLSNNSIAC